MHSLALHPTTAEHLQAVYRGLPHALLLSGAQGIGKETIARNFAEQVLGLEEGSLASYPYVKIIQPEARTSITIDMIRELEHFLAFKVPGSQTIARIAIVLDAQTMTIEAQNALLKTLEEPPERTMVILTSAHNQALLPTIRSRAQIVEIKRPVRSDLEDYLKDTGYSPAAISKALAISGNLPGLTHALLEKDTDHPLVQATEKARNLLQRSAYDRLQSVDELSKDKDGTVAMLYILGQMAHTALTNPQQQNRKRWQTILAATYAAQEQLLGSAQPKLALTNLMLNL